MKKKNIQTNKNNQIHFSTKKKYLFFYKKKKNSFISNQND